MRKTLTNLVTLFFHLAAAFAVSAVLSACINGSGPAAVAPPPTTTTPAPAPSVNFAQAAVYSQPVLNTMNPVVTILAPIVGDYLGFGFSSSDLLGNYDCPTRNCAPVVVPVSMVQDSIISGFSDVQNIYAIPLTVIVTTAAGNLVRDNNGRAVTLDTAALRRNSAGQYLFHTTLQSNLDLVVATVRSDMTAGRDFDFVGISGSSTITSTITSLATATVNVTTSLSRGADILGATIVTTRVTNTLNARVLITGVQVISLDASGRLLSADDSPAVVLEAPQAAGPQLLQVILPDITVTNHVGDITRHFLSVIITNTMSITVTSYFLTSHVSVTLTAYVATPQPPSAITGTIRRGATLFVDQEGIPTTVRLPQIGTSDNINYATGTEWTNNPVLASISAQVAYNLGYTGQGVTVAVIGGGLRTTHERFVNQLVAGTNFVDSNTNVSGTDDDQNEAVGVIAGRRGAGVAGGSHGVAFNAKVMPIRVAGGGDADMLNAMRHAVDNAVPIIQFTPRWARSLLPRTRVSITNTVGGANINFLFSDLVVSPEMLTSNISLPVTLSDYYNHFRALGTIFAGADSAAVWSAGDEGWYDGFNARIQGLRRAVDLHEFGFLPRHGSVQLSVLYDSPNQSHIIGLAPLYDPSLLGKWLVVASFNLTRTSTELLGAGVSGNNGCGRAQYWCIAAPSWNGGTEKIRVPTTGADNEYTDSGDLASDGDDAHVGAAHVAGALAVLRSRFPAMPMRAVVAILLKTADDDGAPGVDPVFGHGVLNLAKAIQVQGQMDLVIPGAAAAAGSWIPGSGSAVTDFSDTQLAAGSGALASRLAGLDVAVSYLGGYYFDVPLSQMTDFDIGEQTSMGNAAADMFDGASRRAGGEFGAMAVLDRHSGQLRRAGYAAENWRFEYDICTDCEAASWNIGEEDGIGSAHFGENQQGMGLVWSPLPAGRLEVFSAMGLGEEADEETHRQYGLRWHDTLSPWQSLSFMAEVSEIREDDSLLGNSGDVFGFTDSRSRQARLALSGTAGGWQWQGGYMHGWTDAGVDRTGLITEVSDINYDQWHVEGMKSSLLQGDDEFRLGVSGLPQVRGLVRFDYYRASNDKFINDLKYSLPTGLSARSLVLRELSEKTMVWRMGYKWRPLPTHKGMQAALGVETMSGGSSDGDYAASFQMRWDF